MNSEETKKAVDRAIETYKEELEKSSKKQKEILAGFVKRLEEKKITEIRKQISS
jgi:hypothetical protein